MFEKSLQDLVKGIRAANNESAAYIAKAIQEIKDELKSRDVTIKTQALQKLTYVSTLFSLWTLVFTVKRKKISSTPTYFLLS